MGDRRGRVGDAVRRVPPTLLSTAVVSGSLLVIAAAVLAIGWLLVLVAPVTLAIVAALLLAALLKPIADLLRRVRVPSALAALGAVLVLLGVLVLPGVVIGQQVAAQFSDLGQQLREGVDRIRQALLDTLPVSERQLGDLWAQASSAGLNALPAPAAGAMVAIEVVGAILLALVLLFFLLKDGPQMWRWVLGLVPDRRRDRVDMAASAGWDALTGYVRGTVVIAAVDAVGIGLALVILGVPLALPLALLTFIAAFIPIVGATVAGAAAVLVALVANGPIDALLVLGAVILVQQMEGNLLEPLVMGRAVRLHAAVILTVVGAGTVLAGVAGALIAVPLTAVSYRVVRSLLSGRDPAEDESATDDGDQPGAEPQAPPERADRAVRTAPA